MTTEEKKTYDREKVAEKYNQKREELYNKYPEYKKYKDDQSGKWSCILCKLFIIIYLIWLSTAN